MPKKTTISLFTVIAIITVIFIIMFYPLINLKNHISGDSNPKTEYVINIYNPLKPRVSEITKLSGDEGYLIIVTDYQRTGLFSFTRLNSIDGKPKANDFESVDAKISGKSLEETKQIALKQDLSKDPYVVEKSEIEKKYEIEKNKEIKCQQILDYGVQSNLSKIADLDSLYKGMTFKEVRSVLKGKGVGEVSDIYIYNLPIDNIDIIKVRLFFNTGVWQTKEEYENIKLDKVTKVDVNCQEKEIPL
jgi:hypothetical protein